jgi:hypothetical protein
VRAAAGRAARLFALGPLLALAACQTIDEKCQRQYPAAAAGAAACVRAALQHENAQMNQRDREEFRARGGG